MNGGYGIYLSNSNGTDAANPGLIANNVIHVGGTGTAWGMYLFNSDFHDIFHNSVQVTSTNTAGGSFYITGGSNVDLHNNIFANSGGGYDYYVNTGASIAASDYNELYATGPLLAHRGGTGCDKVDVEARPDARGAIVDRAGLIVSKSSELHGALSCQ